jgi:calmodulin
MEISGTKKAEYKKAFDIYDKDKDEKINLTELENIMKSIGQKPSESELQDMINEIDIDGEGVITFDGFISLMEKKLRDADTEEELIESFKVFDKDGNGLISSENLRDVVVSLGMKFSQEEIEEMIREADNDGDGFINYEEFVNCVLNK